MEKARPTREIHCGSSQKKYEGPQRINLAERRDGERQRLTKSRNTRDEKTQTVAPPTPPKGVGRPMLVRCRTALRKRLSPVFSWFMMVSGFAGGGAAAGITW